jgi:lysozyme
VEFEGYVNRAVKVKLTQNQFDALVSLVYNIGPPNFNGSTLLRKLNAGDYAGAADQFLVWNKGRVGRKLVVISGLVNRRNAERQLFLRK